MTLRVRIIGAGLIVLAIIGGMKLYLLWPRWYGTEVLLPVTLGTRGGSNMVMASYADSQLQLDATNTLSANIKQDIARVDVRSLGVVWDSRHDPVDEAGRIRNRTVFVQLKTIAATAGTGEALWRPVSISTTLIPGVMNLRVPVRSANASAQIGVGIAGAGAILPLRSDTPHDHASAILKVLPSGRHAIVGVIAGGTRVMF